MTSGLLSLWGLPYQIGAPGGCHRLLDDGSIRLEVITDIVGGRRPVTRPIVLANTRPFCRAE